MAKLTDTLATETRVKDIIATDVQTPSIFGGVSDVLKGFGQAMDQEKIDSSKRKIEAAKAAEDTAKNAAARGAFEVFNPQSTMEVPSWDFNSQLDPNQTAFGNAPQKGPAFEGLQIDPGLVNSVSGIGEELSNMKTAAEQGRGSMASYQVRAESTWRSLMAQYPGQEYAIAKTLKEFGVDTPAMYEFNSLLKAEEAVQGQRTAGVTAAMKAATDRGADPTLPTNELLAIGQQYLKADYELDLRAKQLEFARTNQTMTEDGRKLAEDDFQEGLIQHNLVAGAADFGTFTQNIQSVITNPNIPITEREKVIGGLMPQVNMAFDTAKNKAIQDAYARGAKPETVRVISEQYDSYKKQLADTLSGPLSEATTSMNTLKNIETRFGINTATALPFFNRMKTLFGSAGMSQLFIGNLDEETIRTVKKELTGFQSMTPTEGKQRLDTALGLLTGLKITNLTPEESRKQLPTLMANARSSTELALQQPDNPQIGAVALNALGNIALAGADLNHNSGAKPLTNMLLTLNPGNMNTVKLMVNQAKSDVNPEAARATILQYRAATIKGVQSLKMAPVMEGLYSMAYDRNQGKYTIKFDEKRWKRETPMAAATLSAATGVVAQGMTRKPDVPTDLNRKAVALNNGLEGLVRTGEFDDTMPKGLTPLEIRNFYAAGIVPEKLKAKEGEAKTTSNLTVWKKSVETLMQQAAEIGATPFTPYAQAISQAESTGDPSARNPKSSATGLGQFTNETWVSTISKNRPDLVEGRSKPEILALRNDPQLSLEMIDALGNENGQRLRKAGLPVTEGTKSLAHFTGVGGAIKVLKAAPTDSVEDILGPKVIAANSFLRGMTAEELIQWAENRIG